MSALKATNNGSVQQWIVGRVESSGGSTAEVVGVPELRATAGSRTEAIEQIRTMILDWINAGKLVPIEIACPNPLLHFSDHLDPSDPLEQEFVEELARQRQEDLEATQREYDKECPSS